MLGVNSTTRSLLIRLTYPEVMTKCSDSFYQALFVLDPESGKYVLRNTKKSVEVTNDYVVVIKMGLSIISGVDTFTYQKWTSKISNNIHSMKSYCDSLGFDIE
ncbi:MAG: hypothetical protein GC193_10475 [Cryomorphaceae bacterium]|nr:hypothetical protein [Cryomorphaceae bacterium]